MPKVIDFTFELKVDRVTCPGVWLCQDGHVSLTIYAMGTSYQTCTMPPIFPLVFKDVFYFSKRFQEICTLKNVSCVLNGESLYCELVQWSESCGSGNCTVLAQYLGALNDVLFPPNMCATDGVDLLMRRSKDFPGILSPKIEITTKIRIDELYERDPATKRPSKTKSAGGCGREDNEIRQKTVCHTPLYHRCVHRSPSDSKPQCPSLTRSLGQSASKSCCNISFKENDSNTRLNAGNSPCAQPRPSRTSLLSARHQERCRKYHQYHVYNTTTTPTAGDALDNEYKSRWMPEKHSTKDSKPIVESCYISNRYDKHYREDNKYKRSVNPCVCEICERYYELFYGNSIPTSGPVL